MSDDNPFRSPQSTPETIRHHRRYSPRLVYWMATVAAVAMGFATIGGIMVAARESWAGVPTGLAIAYGIAALWCAHLSAKIGRNELRES